MQRKSAEDSQLPDMCQCCLLDSSSGVIARFLYWTCLCEGKLKELAGRSPGVSTLHSMSAIAEIPEGWDKWLRK